MKRIFYYFIFLIIPFYTYSENFSLLGKYIPDLYCTFDEVDIGETTITFTFKISDEIKRIKYIKSHNEGLLYLKLSEKLPKEFSEEYYYEKKSIETSNKIMILAGKRMESDDLLLFGTTSGYYKNEPFLIPGHFEWSNKYKDCSSFLIEKNKKYDKENLSKYEVDTPWVEGVKGDGKGEWFIIDNHFVYGYLLIMNGYISYEKPYLYKQNGRVKQIKVTGENSGKSKVLDVLDTPHPQTVDISFLSEPEDIRVEIVEVYKGSKYDDTCIHYCTTFTEEVIPYENSIE